MQPRRYGVRSLGLADALQAPPPSPATTATLTASIEAMERALAPAARRFLGTDAAAFLRPLWQMLGWRSFA